MCGRPFTVEDFEAQALAAALSGWERLVYVQVRHKHEVLCGVAHDAFNIRDTSLEFIKVRTCVDDKCYRSVDVRQCSGLDGRCVCAEVDAAPAVGAGEARTAGAALIVPLGNTGTTVAGGSRHG